VGDTTGTYVAASSVGEGGASATRFLIADEPGGTYTTRVNEHGDYTSALSVFNTSSNASLHPPAPHAAFAYCKGAYDNGQLEAQDIHADRVAKATTVATYLTSPLLGVKTCTHEHRLPHVRSLSDPCLGEVARLTHRENMHPLPRNPTVQKNSSPTPHIPLPFAQALQMMADCGHPFVR
jgi:hypothetical protein